MSTNDLALTFVKQAAAEIASLADSAKEVLYRADCTAEMHLVIAALERIGWAADLCADIDGHGSQVNGDAAAWMLSPVALQALDDLHASEPTQEPAPAPAKAQSASLKAGAASRATNTVPA